MIDYKKILKDEEIIDIYKNIAKQNNMSFDHGLNHMNNVVKLMEELAETLGLSERERNKILIACVLHDVGQVDGREEHAEKSEVFARNYLKDAFENKKDLDDVLSAIRNHSSKTPESLSVFDALLLFADKMDFSKKRLVPNYAEKHGKSVYEYVNDISFKCDDDTFYLVIKLDDKATVEELLDGLGFRDRMLKALKNFAMKINKKCALIVNDKEVANL